MDILWWIIIAGILVWIIGKKRLYNSEPETTLTGPSLSPMQSEIIKFTCPEPTSEPLWKILCFLRSENRRPVLDRYAELSKELNASPEIIDLADQYVDMVRTMSLWSMPHPMISEKDNIASYLNKCPDYLIDKYLGILREYEADGYLIELAEERASYWEEMNRDPIHDPVPTHPDLLRGTVVSVAGRFIQSERLYQILSECGATFQKAVTDETTILLQGSNPSIHALAKVKKLQTEGFDIRIMKQSEFYDLIRELHKNQI